MAYKIKKNLVKEVMGNPIKKVVRGFVPTKVYHSNIVSRQVKRKGLEK
jgi:hypothetical protein